MLGGRMTQSILDSGSVLASGRCFWIFGWVRHCIKEEGGEIDVQSQPSTTRPPPHYYWDGLDWSCEGVQ